MPSPFRIVLFFLAIASLCLLCIQSLDLELLPKEKGNQLNVSFAVLSSTPEQTEQQATATLENVLSTVKNLKKITSSSKQNSGNIQLYFDKNEHMDYRTMEVSALIRQVVPQLSTNVGFPKITQQQQGGKAIIQSPLLIYTLTGDGSESELKEFADDVIKRKISRIVNINKVELSSLGNDKVSVSYNLNKLKAFGVSVDDVKDVINRSTNPSFPGYVKNENSEVDFIKVNESITSISDMENLIISNSKDGYPVRLKDVASVVIEQEEISSYFRINGKKAINILVYPRENSNTIYTTELVEEIVGGIRANLPKNFKIELSHDDTVFLQMELKKNYQRTAIALFILLLSIFVAYQSFRHLLNLFLTLCVNLALTISLAWYFEVNIHIYSLAGIAVAFGIMIDHGIIMIDYYKQYKNRSVITALFGATLTTIATLCLVFFLPEEQRKNLEDFSIIIIIALVSSLITNLWFTVGLQDILFAGNKKSIKYNVSKLKTQVRLQKIYFLWLFNISRFRKLFLLGVLLLFGIPLFLLPPKLEGQEWYNNTIGSSFYQENVAQVIDPLLGGTLRLFKLNVYEYSEERNIGKTKLFVKAELPIGNTIDQMNAVMLDVEQYLGGIQGIDRYITNVSSGQSAVIEITFKDDFENSGGADELKLRLTNMAFEWDGVIWDIYGVGQGFNSSSNETNPTFRVKLTGYNFDQLEVQSNLLKNKLLQNQRVQNINTNEQVVFSEKPGQEYTLNVNSGLSKLGGVTPGRLFQEASSMAKSQNPIANLMISDKLLPVYLTHETAESFSRWDLLNANHIIDKKAIQIKNVGDIELQKTSGNIVRENRQYVRALGFKFIGSPQLGRRFLQQTLAEFSKEIPIGYTAKSEIYGGRTGNDVQHLYLILAMLVANFLICSMLFENLKQPFFIIMTIPISFIGLFLIFYLFDITFDQGGYASFILLGALVINAGIFIINDFNALLKKRKQKDQYNKLLLKATVNRSRTIILTTIAAICSLVPFLFDGPTEVFWFSLAIGTIGGLIFSMFAIFIVLPILLWRK